MRNAECGMRSIRAGVAQRTTSPFNPAFRTPHSALVHGADASLSRNEDGDVTHAVTHTPHPTHPSGRITGRPPLSSARAFSTTGQARAHRPPDYHWIVM